MAEQKLLLCYELEKKKAEQIEQLCRSLQIRRKPVGKAFYLQPVGFAAELPGWKKNHPRYDGDGLGEEMLVFSGFDGSALDRFLADYRVAEIAPVPLKAIVTEHNIAWNSLELFAELKREHQQFQRSKPGES